MEERLPHSDHACLTDLTADKCARTFQQYIAKNPGGSPTSTAVMRQPRPRFLLATLRDTRHRPKPVPSNAKALLG
jgi:hypothetical protein